MNKFVEKMKSRWMVNNTKTLLLILILILLFLAINWGVKQLDLIDIDITQNKIYSLTQESIEKIKEVEQEVIIYLFGYTENSNIYTLGRQYNKQNENIKIELVDAKTNPELLEKYEIEEGVLGIVIKTKEREKVLGDNDLVTYDYSTYQTIDITEQKLTNAIVDLTLAKKPKIYFLTGHDEYSLLTNMQMLGLYIINDVYDTASLDLLISDIPEDCDLLTILSPEKDFTQYEANKMIEYINKGGNILWLNDTTTQETEHPYIQQVLDVYGISFKEGIIYETDSGKMPLQDSRFIIPEISGHNITKNLATEGGIMLIQAGELQVAEDDKLEELKIEANPFIRASSTATLAEETGPFIVGSELIKTIDDDTSSTLVAFSCNIFVSDFTITIGSQTLPAISLYHNKDIVLNSIAYLTNRKDAITIRKDTNTVTYTATQKQHTIIQIIIFIIPVIIIITGIGIWQFRRRKK